MSGPNGNTNGQTHGLTTMKKAVKILGGRVIDRRTTLGKALDQWGIASASINQTDAPTR